MARFCPLFSGSSGNCVIAGGADSFVMIDAGMSCRKITTALAERGLELSRLAAIFVTHEHSDHVNALRTLCKKIHVPVYATAGTLCSISAMGFLDGFDNTAVCPPDGIEAGGIFVKPFATMHDTAESCGYTIATADGRKIAVMTDTGCVTDAMRTAISGSDLVYIESNHDVEMLRTGPYPPYLKQRIAGVRGHLSNVDCASELPALVESGSTRFILAHLSRENNIPAVARTAALAALRSTGMCEGRDFSLDIATPDGLPLMVF